MSLVGVLKPSGGADVEVVALHVNFWALTVPITPRGIVEIVKRRGARKAFIDVGVRFRVKSGAIGGLPLILPADTALNDKVTDLSSLVLDESINDLIFGVVTKSIGDQVYYSINNVDVVDTVLGVTKATRTDNGVSSVVFDRNIVGNPDSPTYYVRIRFECRGNSSLLASKDWALAKHGFVFRCLMNDVRATAEMREDPAVAARLLPIQASFVFLIAPSDFIPVLVSPPLYYSRLLEAAVWKRYLESCGAIRASHKYTIHQWRGATEITERQPFRAYMHLHREFGLGVRLTYIIGLLTVPVLSAAYAAAKYFGLWPSWWPHL